jgi:hypothetical protein
MIPSSASPQQATALALQLAPPAVKDVFSPDNFLSLAWQNMNVVDVTEGQISLAERRKEKRLGQKLQFKY